MEPSAIVSVLYRLLLTCSRRKVQGCTCQPRYSIRPDGLNDDGRPHADHTFRSWADEWLTKRLRRPGKNTIRDYRSTVGIANSVFGDKQLRKLSSRDILDLLDKLDGRANNTQRKHLRNLNGAFESAVRAGLIRRNPIASLGDAELPRAVKVPPAYFTDVELVRLYAALERKQDGVRLYDDVYPVLVRAAVMTGLRKGELVELRWRDVDLVTAASTCSAHGTTRPAR